MYTVGYTSPKGVFPLDLLLDKVSLSFCLLSVPYVLVSFILT